MIAIIQARTNSTRLPGKVLMEIAGKPIIHHVIDACRDFLTVVAVPSGDKDLIKCIGSKAPILQGPEDNVAERFAEVITVAQAPYFLRICADSPALTREVVSCPTKVNYPDYTIVRTVGTAGLNVELVDSFLFLFLFPDFNEYDREHVTSHFYDVGFKIWNIPVNGEPCVVDTQEDFDRVKAMMEA